MRKLLLVAGMIAATAIPTMSFAATRCEQDQASRRTTGTVIGALAGGLLGNTLTRGGARTGGTAIGAVGGAVVGNQLARQNNVCPEGYRAYDDHQRVTRDPAAYYGSDYRENRYVRRHHHHSDGYIRYQNDVAADARGYGRDSAYSETNRDGDRRYDDNRQANQQTWRDANGRLCAWRDDVYDDDRGGQSHRWVQDCR